MSTILLILALFSFICGLSFILGGFIGMLDFEPPKSALEHLFRCVDLLFTNGLIWFLQSAVTNWSSRAYERRVLMTGFGCLLLTVALALLAFKFPSWT